MINSNWFLMATVKRVSVIFTIIIAASIVLVSSDVSQEEERIHHKTLHPTNRNRRSAVQETDDVHSGNELGLEERDKKTPRGFLGLRGKKAPSSFLGLRGRRTDGGVEYSEEDHLLPYRSYQDVPNSLDEYTYPRLGEPLQASEQIVRPLELMKRTPSGFLGMRGKKAPSGFLGLRGKKAPSGFLGMRGKKTPSGFLGLRGKKEDIDYENLESVLQELRQNESNPAAALYAEDKRTPRGFLGLRGKKNSAGNRLNYGGKYYDSNTKRAAYYSRFLGLRG